MKKIDKIFITIIAVLGIIALCVTIFSSFECERKPRESRTAREIDGQIDRKDVYLNVDFLCIDDIVYYSEDNVWNVEYDNPDQFDYDNLACVTGRDSWYGDYVKCEIDGSLVPQLNEDIMLWKQADEYRRDSLENRWTIRQHWISEINDYVFQIELK